MKNNCENCTYFDNEKHKNDSRTKHAGLCKKWSEITFLRDTCKQFFSKENPDDLKNTLKLKIENTNTQTFLTF